jgi:trk system potassium uptake protein TrkA
VHTPLRQLTSLFPDLNIIVVGIIRDDSASVPTPQDQMLPGDSVYFVADTEHVPRAMAAFGHEEQEARRIIILGGGNIGLSLAHLIEASKHDVSVKVIEHGAERARLAAETMPGTAIILGDCLDPEILAEANVSMTETVVAVTDDDETNILGSLLAKRYGAERAVTLINKTTYSPLITTLGIDVVVSPRAITVSTILQHVRRGRIRAVHSLGDGFAEVIEADALETSPLVGKPLKEAKLPRGVIVGAVVHDDQVIIPSGDTIINPDDRIIILAAADVVKKVEKLFSVRLEFF